MSLKAQRIEQIIKKEVSQILQFELKDNKVGFVTVTDVSVTNDLSYATIYVNFLGSQDRGEAGMKALERSKGFIKTTLAKRLTIRKAPNLIFKIDNSLEEGNKIENILRELKK